MSSTDVPPESVDVDDLWLSTERLLEIVDLAEARSESDVDASVALNDLSTENLILRNQVAVSTGAFSAMARVLDGVIFAADRTNNEQLIGLLEVLLRAEGLLEEDTPLVERKPSLVVPDVATTKRITHKGRITEVS